MTMLRRLLSRIVWPVGIATTTATTYAMGDDQLSPSQWTPSGLHQWLSSSDPAILTFGTARMLVLLACLYLCLATTLGLAARLLGLARLSNAVDSISLPIVRRAVEISLAGLVTMPSAAHADTVITPDAAPVLRHLLPGEEAHASVTTPPAQAKTTQATAARTTTRTIRSGENLWVIAQDALIEQRGAQPSESEIVRYWHRLVEQNRHVLVDASNPDLIFPGQTVELPVG